MKRARKSGAAYRKKRKAREQLLKKNEGAQLKYISRIETTTTEAGELYKPKSSSISRDSTSSDSSPSPLSSDEEHEQNIPGPAVNRVDIKDVGLWPSKMSNDMRIFLVRQGASVVQNLDSDFGEVIRQGVSTKGQTRRLTREWFFKTLPNGERMLRSWMVYSPSKETLCCFCCKLFQTEVTQNLILRTDSRYGGN